MKTTPRLHLDPRLGAGLEIALTEPQSHYLRNVLRLSPGDPVRAFNGHDGEWLCYLADGGKRHGLHQRQVHAREPGQAQRVAPDVAKRADLRDRERARIEPQIGGADGSSGGRYVAPPRDAAGQIFGLHARKIIRAV